MTERTAAAAARSDASGLGRWGEAYAAAFIENRGLRIVARNWRCGDGEIDIIALDRGQVVFLEVKTRRDHSRGTPLAAITPAKLAQIQRLARTWLRENAAPGVTARVDAIAITRPRTGATVIEHIRGLT